MEEDDALERGSGGSKAKSIRRRIEELHLSDQVSNEASTGASKRSYFSTLTKQERILMEVHDFESRQNFYRKRKLMREVGRRRKFMGVFEEGNIGSEPSVPLTLAERLKIALREKFGDKYDSETQHERLLKEMKMKRGGRPF